MPDISLDWSTALKSPLVLLLPVTVLTALLTWCLTEVLGFVIPPKHRPGVALIAGMAFGWAVNRLEIIDFGWGPEGWGRALFFGLLAGIMAVLGHARIKSLPIFKQLAAVTPGATPEVKP